MKKILALTVLPLALASCNMFGVPNGDVSGNILGPQPSGTIRLALTEVSTSGIGETVIDQFNVRTFNPEKRAYIVSLKQNPTNGIYELFAYVDANNDNHYQPSEKRATAPGVSFYYSQEGLGDKTGKDTFNLQPGWTMVKNLVTVVDSDKPFNLDLNW